MTWLTHTCKITHSHTRDATHPHIRDTTDSYTWRDSLTYMWHDSPFHVIWLTHTCDVTPSHIRDMTHSYTWYDSLIRMTYVWYHPLTNTWQTHPYMWRGSLTYTWHDSLIHVIRLTHTYDIRVISPTHKYVTRLTHTCELAHSQLRDMAHSYTSYDSLIRTHIYMHTLKKLGRPKHGWTCRALWLLVIHIYTHTYVHTYIPKQNMNGPVELCLDNCALHCNTLQHTATHCTTLHRLPNGGKYERTRRALRESQSCITNTCIKSYTYTRIYKIYTK